MTLNPRIKLLFDILPLLVFFTGFKLSGLYVATGALIGVTLVILIVTYVVERKLALAPLITALVVGIFGVLTLWFKDETFIKIKPTLVNLIFALILLGGCIRGKALLKPVLGTAFNLTERGWFLLSRRWGIFFMLMGLLNELVWRNTTTETWVNFKVFGLIGLTMLFAVSQMGFIQKHQIDSR